MTDLKTTWDDPDLDAKACEFFLDHYNGLRHQLLRAKRKEQESSELPDKAEAKDGNALHIGLDNLPRKILPEQSFLYMMRAYNDITRLTTAVPYPTKDAAEAGLFLVRRVILCLANRFAFITQMFPMLDDRYRTTMTQIKCDVTGFFAVNDWAEETLSVLTRVPAYMALVLKLMPGQKVSTAFGDVLATLAMLSRIYFNMVGASYGLPEVGACSRAFDGVLLSLTNQLTIESRVNAYRDSCREMHAAIVTYVKNGYQTDVQKLAAEMAKANAVLQAKLDELLAKEEKTNSGGRKKRRYRCKTELAANYFKVSVATIERWRAYNRNPNDPNATRPPAEFPNGDVSKEEMRNAGRKYLSLIAA